MRETEKKKLLIYAHYYVPDVAATAQILRELAEGLRDRLDVTVICTVPSYDGHVGEEYRTKQFYRERIGGVEVVRIRVPEFDKTRKLTRVKNILAYFFGAVAATFTTGKADYVYSISQPPVLGGLLGVWGKLVKRARYIYNIQDFNPEQIMAVGYSHCKPVLWLMMFCDKISCRMADKVILVGEDMADTLRRRFGSKKIPPFCVINNWVNERELLPLPTDHEGVRAFRRQYGLEDKYVVMYSGNIGFYYDLDGLIRVMNAFSRDGTPIAADGREVVFAFVGAGGMKEALEQYVYTHKMKNVVFIPYQEKKSLGYSLNAADVHWVVSARGIKGVSTPSKCYGVMACGKPVLGVLEQGTEIERIVRESGCGLLCEPGDYDQVAENLRWFTEHAGEREQAEMGSRGRSYLEKYLTMEISLRRYADEIMSC